MSDGCIYIFLKMPQLNIWISALAYVLLKGKKVIKSAYEQNVAHQAGAYPGFL